MWNEETWVPSQTQFLTSSKTLSKSPASLGEFAFVKWE